MPCGRTKTLNASFRNANTLGIRRAGSRLARKDEANGRNSRRTCSGRQRSSVRPGPADPLVPVEGWPAVRAGGAAALACEGTRGFQRPAPMRKWLPGSHRSTRRGRPASIRAPGAHVECCRGAFVPSCYRSIIYARPACRKGCPGRNPNAAMLRIFVEVFRGFCRSIAVTSATLRVVARSVGSRCVMTLGSLGRGSEARTIVPRPSLAFLPGRGDG